MFPENPFLQLSLTRASALLGRLSSAIWTTVAEVPVSFAGCTAEIIPFNLAPRQSFEPVALPFHWGKLFDQAWFKLAVPAFTAPGPLYLHWQDQGEGTLYLDNTPYFGFDVAHRYCPLPAGGTARDLYMEGLCLQSAIWHPAANGLDPEGSRLTAARLVTRDELAWETYHDLRALYDLAYEEGKAAAPLLTPSINGPGYHPPVDSVPVLYRRLLRTLDDAVNAHDRGGLAACRDVLKEAYRRFEGQHERIRAALTGHAHLDLVWLWPERAGEYKAVHTFSTMNRLMDSYPEMIFAYSQTASYDAVGRISPSLLDAVRARVAQGRWEPAGAMEVESDTLLACGEALARSFHLGQRGFAELQGKPSRVCWLPDVFGYCGCLPQIMRQSGVEFFFTTKLTWSNINLFPYSSFVWKGTDGTEILVHVTQENSYVQAATPEEVRRGARAHRQSDVHDEFLAPTGFGDGGGGVTEDMCERARRYRSVAGMPEVGWTRIDDFFERLDAVRPRLPAYQGELYLEYHRGVLTTHGGLKAAFRAAERGLQTREAVRCARGGGELDEQPWKRLIFAQFHDYIPGTSIWEVYEQGVPELARVGADALADAAKELTGEGADAPAAVFNPLPVSRIHLVRDGINECVKAILLPPLAGVVVEQAPAIDIPQTVDADAQALRSASVKVEFDARAQISRLTIGGHDVALRGPLAQLAVYPDAPNMFEAWDIDRQTLSLEQTVETPAEWVMAHVDDGEGTTMFRRKLGANSTALVSYRLDAFEPVLHIEYQIDWREEQTLLKVLFPTAYTGRVARFGAPFGSVTRGQQAGNPRDEAMFEAAGSRWAVVSDDGEAEGLGVVTEAKYGWGCREGTLGLSLVRSAAVTGSDVIHERLFPAGLRRDGAGPRPKYSDLGKHLIKLAVCLHAPGQEAHRSAAALADTLFTPALDYRGGAVAGSGFEGLEDAGTLLPCWAKPAADGEGWILRMHETFGRRGVAKLRLTAGTQAFRTDLSEGDLATTSNPEVPYLPYELISLRIKPSR